VTPDKNGLAIEEDRSAKGFLKEMEICCWEATFGKEEIPTSMSGRLVASKAILRERQVVTPQGVYTKIWTPF